MPGPTYMKSQPNNGMWSDLNKKGFAAAELERHEISDMSKGATILAVNHDGDIHYLFGSRTIYDATQTPAKTEKVFGLAQNSTSVVSPISLSSKVHGYSATIENKISLPNGMMRGRRLEPDFLSGTPWEEVRESYICFIPNAMFLPFGTDLILGNISNEDIREQIKTKWAS